MAGPWDNDVALQDIPRPEQAEAQEMKTGPWEKDFALFRKTLREVFRAPAEVTPEGSAMIEAPEQPTAPEPMAPMAETPAPEGGLDMQVGTTQPRAPAFEPILEEEGVTPTPVPRPKTSPSVVISNAREAAVDQLKLHEGYKPYPYQDSRGFWTIGIGHLIGDGSSKGEYAQYSESNPMPESEVLALFEKDFNKHVKIAEQYPAYEKLNETGKLALIDMTFNMGDLRKDWTGTLKLLEEGKYEEAATVIENSKYATQVGDRAKTVAAQIRAAGM